MIIRQTPKNKEKYIVVRNGKMIYELQSMGILPKYVDSQAMYFVKSEELMKYLEDKELEQWWN